MCKKKRPLVLYNHEPNNYKCPFCSMLRSGLQASSDVVYVSENVFACLGLHHQENSGPTVLVIPTSHVENIYDITDSLLQEISVTAKFIALNMRSLWGTRGITIWQHNEPIGSQDVWHFHMHVKSRLEGDSLYQSRPIVTDQNERTKWASELRECIACT